MRAPETMPIPTPKDNERVLNDKFQYSLVFFRFVSVVLFGPLNGLFTEKKRTFPALMSHNDSIPDFQRRLIFKLVIAIDS